jgi:sulfotransferase family protein
MRLIGAGLPRTATLTQKVALEMLGVGPTYHMVDVLQDMPRLRQWQAALDGNPDWDAIFDGYNSTVDWPGSFFYRELKAQYPEAKMLLSVRSGESWAKSMIATISSFLYGDSLMHHLSMARGTIDPLWQSYTPTMQRMWRESDMMQESSAFDVDVLARQMERYNAQVQAEFPDVLVWSPADGWEPICDLLELPVPDEPFPHVNDSASFEALFVNSSLQAINDWHAQQAPVAGH